MIVDWVSQVPPKESQAEYPTQTSDEEREIIGWERRVVEEVNVVCVYCLRLN
jgi:hypothetical protein